MPKIPGIKSKVNTLWRHFPFCKVESFIDTNCLRVQNDTLYWISPHPPLELTCPLDRAVGDLLFVQIYCYVRYYDAAKILRTQKLTKEMNWRLLATISRHFIDFGSAISLLKTVVLLCFRSIVIVKMVEMLLEMFYLCFISSDNNFIQWNLRKSNR